MRIGRLTLALLAGLLTLVPSLATAEIPAILNYQVMLTDDADQPLADQAVVMVFTIYDAESGGTALWTETQNPTTNSIGVVSVILGSVTPVGFDFDVPLWLEVEVDGETLSPRRELTAAPYAGHAAGADDSDKLGGIDAGEYALLTDLVGTGDGHSLDADDGDPTDALYVDSEGKVGIGTTSPTSRLTVKDNMLMYSESPSSTFYMSIGSTPYIGVSLISNTNSGGALTLNHPSGASAVTLKALSGSNGGGYLAISRGDGVVGGFEFAGNGFLDVQEPRMAMTGSSRSAVLDMFYSGDDSVQLPDDAISSDEVFNEPGVSSIQADSWRDVGESVTSVAARYVDAPAAGYVFISATAVVEFDNRTNQGHFVYLGLSELQNAWSTHAQEFYVSIPGGEYGHYYDTVTVTGIFEVAEGTHTFYLNAQEFTGEVRIGERQFNVLYFPTAYGTVDLDD